MNNLLHAAGWRSPGRLSEPALVRIGAVSYFGALATWVIMVPLVAASGFDRQFYSQVLAFAVPFAAAAIPAHHWLSGRPAAARTAALGALAGIAILTAALPILPVGLRLVALAGQGLLTAIAAGIALIRLRAASEPDHAGRILGTAGGVAVVAIIGSRLFGGEAADMRSVPYQILPLLVAAAVVQWLPIGPRRPSPPVIVPRADVRWVVAAFLTACAVALTAAASYGDQGGSWSDMFCVAGFILCGVLLDTERFTICIGAGATAAVLAALSSQPVAGAISGLAQGLLQPLPWYIAMTRLRRDAWTIVLACGQAVVWAGWIMWDATRQTDAALMAAMVSLLSLSIVGTFVTNRNTLAAQRETTSHSDDAPDHDLETHAEQTAASPPATVADALKQVYGDLLTPRELQVGQLVVLGVASREIAAQLYLSESTVKTHLKSVYRKTETANRNDLYRRLVAAGNEEVPPQIASSRLAVALASAPRDSATGLFDRETFEQVATEQVTTGQASRRPTAILFMSLRVESRAADKQAPLVAVVAGILQSSLRTMDLLFRYGDHEFVAILPGCEGQGAQLAGQRLAYRIRVWAAGRPTPPALAVGWSSTAEGAHTVTALVAEAIGRTATHPL